MSRLELVPQTHFNAALDELRDWASARQGAENKRWGLPWPWQDLDTITGGIHPGQLLVALARTGDGKSVFVTQVAFNLAKHLIVSGEEGSVLIFSPEMTMRSLLERVIQMKAGIPSELVNRGEVDDVQLDVWHQTIEKIRPYAERVEIMAGDSINIGDVTNLIDQRHLLSPVKLVVVDYIQYLEGSGQNKYEKVTDAATKLKAMANRLNIPILIAAQANKPAFDKNSSERDRAPKLTELADSQYVARVADLVVTIWRPEDNRGTAKIEVVKQRSGPSPRSFTLTYEARHTRFDPRGSYKHGK